MAFDHRSVHDAIQQSHIRLCGGHDTWVLEADIKGVSNISHEFILKSLGKIPGRANKQWLKAGYRNRNVPRQKGYNSKGIISLAGEHCLDGLMGY